MAAKKVSKQKPEQYVTKSEFEEFGNRMVDAIERLGRPVIETPVAFPLGAPTPGQTTVTYTAPNQVQPAMASMLGNTPLVETPAEREVRKASANEVPMNPEWEEMARDIIGEAVDHCEIAYLKNGGVLFTVVIKPEFSNATIDYLAYYHSDRRSKEIGQEGVSGVEEWCKLIKSNLSRNK